MKALGWILFGVALAVLLWMWNVDAGAMAYQKDEAAKRERALKAESDSLADVLSGRDERITRGDKQLKELRAYYDSVFRAMPTVHDAYIAHREEAARRSLSDKWRYMGVVTVQPPDSASAGHP